MIELRRRDGRVLRVGHRGAAALEPENTIRSLRRAVELGVDLVEFDVLALADGTLVLAHSTDLRELSHGATTGRVRRRTLDELRRVAPEVPTLDEALAFLAEDAPQVGVHVDLKCRGREAAIVAALRRHELVERAVVSSFRTAALRAVAAVESRIRLGLTYPEDRLAVTRFRAATPFAAAAAVAMRRALPSRIGRRLARAGASAAMLNYQVVSRAVVDRCHEHGAAVFVWTVDDPSVARMLAELGVDGVITNDPRTLAAPARH